GAIRSTRSGSTRTSGRRLRPRSAADEEVRSPAEPVDDPVEVALALPVALVVEEAQEAAVVMAGGRHVEAHGSPGRTPLPLVAQHQAPPDVEIAVVAEALV